MSTTLYNQYIYKNGDWKLVGTSIDPPTKTSDLINDSGFITAQSPALTGTPTAPNPTEYSGETQIATKKYVDDAISSGGYGTVTSVRVQASSPVLSSVDTPQTSVLNTTISLDNGYGDIKNPYTSKTKNTVLAAPASTNGVPSFRALESNDLPSITKSKISDFPNDVSDFTNDAGYITTSDIPVTSVNSKTGAVVLTAGDVNALPDTTVIPTATSDLTNDSNFVSDANYVHTDNNFTNTLKTKLEGIEAGAEVNQNAFSNVKVGTSTIAADTKTDTLTLTAGSNITLTPDATNDAVTIAATVPTKVSDLTNDSNFITAAGAPVQSVNSKTGSVTLTASDVGALPDDTDVTKWNNVELDKNTSLGGLGGYIPLLATKSETTAYLQPISSSPTASNIAQYNNNAYLTSTTPAANDNSTKVATTAFVNTVISNIDVLPDQTSHNGDFLTTNGTAASWESLPEEVFVATYGTTTLAEILEAYNAGKFIYAVKSNNPGRLVPLEEYVSSIPQFYFSYITRGGTPQYWAVSNSGWTSTANTFGYVPTTRTINSKSLSNSITLTASDVGALPDSTTIPTATSDLTNDSGFITSSDIPVTSVNNKTGAVSLTASDVGALTNSYFGYFDSDNNIVYAPKNWNSSYLFPFVVRTVSSTLRTGATVRAFDSSTNLWTISSIYYDGVAKTLPLSLSYGIYLMRYSDGTTDIYRIAKASDIPTLTSTPTANKGAQYDSSAYLNSTTPSANDNSTKVATTAYVDNAVAGGGSAVKAVTSPALTASNEIFTWNIAAADAFSSSDVIISIYDTATGAIVYPDIVVNQTTGAVTITIHDTASAGSLTASAYRAVMIG